MEGAEGRGDASCSSSSLRGWRNTGQSLQGLKGHRNRCCSGSSVGAQRRERLKVEGHSSSLGVWRRAYLQLLGLVAATAMYMHSSGGGVEVGDFHGAGGGIWWGGRVEGAAEAPCKALACLN
jgi:hypothetical protein